MYGTHDMLLSLLFPQRIEIRQQQLAKLVLDLPRHNRILWLSFHSLSECRELVGIVDSSSRGRGRREVEVSEMLCECDSQRGCQRQRFLVRRELDIDLSATSIARS
jgi:hypothetical protein